MASARASTTRSSWLNRNVWGMAVTSFLSDTSHEMATSVLPSFLTALGSPPLVLGAIEGVSDALSSFVKLGAGWYSDKVGRRKGIVVAGYFITGVALSLFAFANGWALVMVARALGWLGRGVRGPLRDAMLLDSVDQKDRGKAFGFHRAGDTLGAIVGPLTAAALLGFFKQAGPGSGVPALRGIFLLTLLPGVGSAVAFASLVKEKHGAGKSQHKFWATLHRMPSGFRRYLVGIATFGIGDFSHTLLILAATQILKPSWGITRAAQVAAILYVLRNVSYTLFSYPVGLLSDRLGRRYVLVFGYAIGAVTMLGFSALFAFPNYVLPILFLLFTGAGLYIAVEDTLEGALTADLVPDSGVRATALGLLGVVNGVGDLVSSLVVGGLWNASPPMAFAYSAFMMLAGALVLSQFR